VTSRIRRLAFGLALGGLLPAPAVAIPIPCQEGTSCERAPVGWEPAYPAGGAYDVFVGNTFGDDIRDEDGDGAFNDERCDTNVEAGLAEIRSVVGVLVALGTTCEALPAGRDIPCTVPPLPAGPAAQEFCNIPLAAAAVGLELNAIDITRCDIQGRLVDGAEMEAAYENTKLVLARDLEQHLRACNQLVGLFLPRQVGGRLEEVRAFVDLRIKAYEQADAESPESFSRSLSRAKFWFGRGDERLAASRYKDAFRGYCAAYRTLREIAL
jgi:hypothetical protein